MSYKAPSDSKFLPLQFKPRLLRRQSWWAPIWRGLIVEPTGKHYRAMRSSVWLYLYFVIHADRATGTLFRKINTISHEMGVKPTTIRRWLAVLVKQGYITRSTTGR